MRRGGEQDGMPRGSACADTDLAPVARARPARAETVPGEAPTEEEAVAEPESAAAPAAAAATISAGETAEKAALELQSKLNLSALPVRQYLESSVVPVLLQGLQTLVKVRRRGADERGPGGPAGHRAPARPPPPPSDDLRARSPD